jgi:hypothetical protein
MVTFFRMETFLDLDSALPDQEIAVVLLSAQWIVMVWVGYKNMDMTCVQT